MKEQDILKHIANLVGFKGTDYFDLIEAVDEALEGSYEDGLSEGYDNGYSDAMEHENG